MKTTTTITRLTQDITLDKRLPSDSNRHKQYTSIIPISISTNLKKSANQKHTPLLSTNIKSTDLYHGGSNVLNAFKNLNSKNGVEKKFSRFARDSSLTPPSSSNVSTSSEATSSSDSSPSNNKQHHRQHDDENFAQTSEEKPSGPTWMAYIEENDSNTNPNRKINTLFETPIHTTKSGRIKHQVLNQHSNDIINTHSKNLNSNDIFDSSFRRDFLKKQHQLRRSTHHRPMVPILSSDETNNKNLDLMSSNKTKTPILANHSIVNVRRSNSKNSSDHVIPTLTSSKAHQESSNNSQNTTATTTTTTIILDLEKYKINDKKANTPQQININKIMVNIPLAPKKFHTFNENDANEQNSHKETNGNKKPDAAYNESNNAKQTNEDIFSFAKPIMRTGSNIQHSTNTKNLLKNAVRRPPKEFLASTKDIKVEEDIIIPLNSVRSSSNEVNELNRGTSPTTKSLPTYDEVLKRACAEVKATNGSYVNNNNNPKLTNGKSIDSNNINFPSNYSTNNIINTNTNGVYKNSRHHALPNFPMQSTFKSLLSIPINGSNTSSSKAASSYVPTKLSNNANAKVYFRPQDLQHSPSRQSSNVNPTNKGLGSICSASISNESIKDIGSNDKTKYISQKNSTERLYNGLPVSVTPLLTPHYPSNARSGSGSGRRVVLNTSPSLSKDEKIATVENGEKKDNQMKPQHRSMSPILRTSSSLKNTNENLGNTNGSGGTITNARSSSRIGVTPISISSSSLNEMDNENIKENDAFLNTNSNNNYATTTQKTTLIKTLTTTTEKMIDTVVRSRIQSPDSLVNHPSNTIDNDIVKPINDNDEATQSSMQMNERKLNNNAQMINWSTFNNFSSNLNSNENFNADKNLRTNLSRVQSPIAPHPPQPAVRSSSATSNYNDLNNWKTSVAIIKNSNQQNEKNQHVLIDYMPNTNDSNKTHSREAYSITGSSNVNSFESNLNNINQNYNDNVNKNYHLAMNKNKMPSIENLSRTTPTNLFKNFQLQQQRQLLNSNEDLEKPIAIKSHLGFAHKNDSGIMMATNIKKENDPRHRSYDYNVSLAKSGKLLDAISAASNSIEDGLGPALVKKSKGKNSFTSKLNFFNNNLSNSNKIAEDKSRNKNESKEEMKRKAQNLKNVIESKSSRNGDVEANNFEDNLSLSFSTTFSSSNEINNNKNSSIIGDEVQKNSKKQEKNEFGRIYSGLNDAIINFKPSSSESTSNNNGITSILNLRNNTDSTSKKVSYNNNDPTLDRPPARLNYYDSDTNTLSEGMFGSELRKVNGNNHRQMRMFSREMTDSPNLSDITEGKFDDIEGGHRTSTPNMSKHKPTSSLSSPEIKTIKKQIQELEKMYFEILRIIDTEKQTEPSEISRSSTSISSFTPSLSEFRLRHDSNNNTNQNDKKSLNKNHRSSSVLNTNFSQSQKISNKNKSSHIEIKHLKSRFNRMESHLTSLAKTVAQISVELKSIKSIEDVINNLRMDLQNLKNNEIVQANLNDNPIIEQNNKLNDISNKYSSDPSIFNKAANTELNSNNQQHKQHSERKASFKKKQEFQNEKERLRSWMPTYSNPKKLRKLTKFFGQEPPILRMFLQKLNYEDYAQNFEAEHITITELPYLSEEKLKSLGIPLGPRLRILQEAQSSFQKNELN